MNTSDTDNQMSVAGGEYVSGEVNTGGGDFVGRDKAIFIGLEKPSEQIINIVGEVQGDVVVYPSTSLGRIGTQIERLRGRITRLIPAELALLQLSKLREPKPLGSSWSLQEITFNTFFIETKLSNQGDKKSAEKEEIGSIAHTHLKQLNDIEAKLLPTLEQAALSTLLKNLSSLTDQVNIHISQLNSLFTSVIYPATTSRELIENMVSKIGHKELKEEANMHLGVIGQLVDKLDSENLTRADFDVLSDEAYRAVGIATELEKRRMLVEGLVRQDRQRRNWTVGSVIGYICLIVALVVSAIYFFGPKTVTSQTPLSQLRVPILGIPWPVIVWSLVGSFAAMVHRFNTNPIYDFGDAVKWMITRPIQGVVLGLALYLILVSGLFLLTGASATGSAGIRDEAILVLCFFVGFSDRFADSVFNALVRKYSTEQKDGGENKN